MTQGCLFGILGVLLSVYCNRTAPIRNNSVCGCLFISCWTTFWMEKRLWDICAYLELKRWFLFLWWFSWLLLELLSFVFVLFSTRNTQLVKICFKLSEIIPPKKFHPVTKYVKAVDAFEFTSLRSKNPIVYKCSVPLCFNICLFLLCVVEIMLSCSWNYVAAHFPSVVIEMKRFFHQAWLPQESCVFLVPATGSCL